MREDKQRMNNVKHLDKYSTKQLLEEVERRAYQNGYIFEYKYRMNGV